MINRPSLTAILLSAATVAVAACADAPTAAPSASSLEPTASLYTSGSSSGSSVTVSSGSSSGSSSATVRLTVSPTMSVTMAIGNHKLVLPAGAICDLATSGYGPTMWNAPCTPSKTSVTITAKYYTNASGRAEVDFQPALRFVPSKTVTLHLMDKTASLDAASKVLYCVTSNTPCVDEALADPSLASSRDPKTGFVFRRIKHFSGYNVTFGRSTTSGGQ